MSSSRTSLIGPSVLNNTFIIIIIIIIIIIAVLYVCILITAENSIMRRLPVAHEPMHENLSVSYATISNCYLKNLLIYLNLKNILLYNLQY